MKVLKFGGTSVASAERIQALAKLINDNEPKVIVLSAMSGTTNSLDEIAHTLNRQEFFEAEQLIIHLENKYFDEAEKLFNNKESHKKAKDFISSIFDFLRTFLRSSHPFSIKDERVILAQGELLSTTLFHFFLEQSGVASALLPALDFMRTDENKEPDFAFIEKSIKQLLDRYHNHNLFITQGYICRNAAGETDNLKRGGSDYSATIIGAVLNADEIQIWTDIDGMHNNDPRIVKNTRPIAELSFEEAAELAYFGAKILHPACVQPAKVRGIPVRLLNTMQPDAHGTLISESTSRDEIKAIAAKDNITAIKIKSARMLLSYGFLRGVFSIFEKYQTPIDVITTSEVAVSLTIDNTENLDGIESELKKFCDVKIDSNLSIICIVGNFSAEKQGYASRVFDALKHIPIRMISYGGSSHNVTIVVNTEYKNDALISLNSYLFNGRSRIE